MSCMNAHWYEKQKCAGSDQFPHSAFPPTGHNLNKWLSGLKITCLNFSSPPLIISLQSLLSKRGVWTQLGFSGAGGWRWRPSQPFPWAAFSSSSSQTVLARADVNFQMCWSVGWVLKKKESNDVRPEGSYVESSASRGDGQWKSKS